VWQQRTEGIEPRHRITFHVAPGTANWEEVEAKALIVGLSFRARHDLLDADRFGQAVRALRSCLESNPEKLGGVLIFRGTRFSPSQFLAELADDDAVRLIANNFEVDESQLRRFLHALAVYLDRPAPAR
jgi:uncharacterized protein (DUF433 family)